LPGFWRFGGEGATYGLNPYAPSPGVYAISATNLQGVKLADPDTYAWFREREPDAQIGYSILVYEVPGRPATASATAAVLGVPLSQLAREERELLARVGSVRRYDPQTGTIAPTQATEVWTITAEPLEWGEIVREHASYTVRRGLPPAVAQATADRDASFGGFVVPLDIEISETGEDRLTAVVRWRVERPPHRAAVSFAHLLDAEGRYLSGWDGLAAPATCWQAGDWIEQRYVMSLPPDFQAGSYQIEVGWYDADTGSRWSYLVNGQAAGDRMLKDWTPGSVGTDG
jgi:hypothetical protein